MSVRAATTLLLTLLLPLAGVLLAGRSVAPFLEIPPQGQARDYPGFSWPAFAGLWLLFAGLVWAWIGRARRQEWKRAADRAGPHRGRFPWWGWAGILACGCFWAVAWSPDAPPPLRRYTFPLLWSGFVLAVNGLVRWRTGTCPLTGETAFFAALFPASAAFWWLFEYLNRFVDNWVYLTGRPVGDAEYLLHASLSFATVLPAVYSVRRLLDTLPGLRRRLARGPSLRVPKPRLAGALLLLLCAAAMAGVGLAPASLFPFLWIGPLGIWVGLELLQRARHPWPEIEKGDWSAFLGWALAALVCGFFWELWNLRAMPKWEYQVPWFGRFHLFEMPVSGYLGYLPFGLECALAVSLVRRWRRKTPAPRCRSAPEKRRERRSTASRLIGCARVEGPGAAGSPGPPG
jgi:hypothetical protein